MITFSHRLIEQEFYQLPFEKQREIIEFAKEMARRWKVVVIEGVEIVSGAESEVAIRIDDKFNGGPIDPEPA